MKNKLPKKAVISAAIFACCIGIKAQTTSGSDVTYQDINGMVVIEAETAPLDGGWTLETSTPDDFTGAGFVKAGSNGILTYRIQINNPALYRMIARTTRTNDVGDQGNDSHILFTGPDVYAYGNGNWYDEITGGGGMAGIEVDVGKYGLYTEGEYWKISTHTNNDSWSWQSTNAVESEGFWKFFHFDIRQAGEYTLELKQRSAGHKIDRIHFFDETVDWATTAQDITLAPTVAGGTPVVFKVIGTGSAGKSLIGMGSAGTFDLMGRRTKGKGDWNITILKSSMSAGKQLQ